MVFRHTAAVQEDLFVTEVTDTLAPYSNVFWRI